MEAACVCEGGSLRAAIRADLDRYVLVAQTRLGLMGLLVPLRAWLLSEGLWATTAYRLTHYARYRLHSRLLGIPPFICYLMASSFTGIKIHAQAHIGPGLRIPHGGYIVIGPARIGRNCEIFQGVSLGESVSAVIGANSDGGANSKSPLPAIGNRVWIGPGAVIAGGVTVGDDASIGANSLVVRDVPSRGVVLGVPARLVSRRGSFAQIRYRGEAHDDERSVALAEAEAAPDGHDSPSRGPDHRPATST